jgi:hypothetical protein
MKYSNRLVSAFIGFAAFITIVILIFLEIIPALNRSRDPGTEITKSHLSQLTYVVETIAPFCDAEYFAKYESMSKDGLDPNEVLLLLDLTLSDYRKGTWTDRSGREPVELFALNELPCIYFKGSKSLRELTSELYTHQYKEVSDLVVDLDSPELKNTVNSLFEKGHLTFLDKLIIEQSTQDITKQRLINSLKSSVSQ